MNELVFEVIEEADGGYCAECLTESIVTEGNSWDGLRANVREAVRGYYFDQPEKLAVRIRLRLVRDEVLAAGKSRATSLAAVKHWNYRPGPSPQRVLVRDHSALRIGTQRPLWVDRRKRNAAPRRRCGDGRP
jgi:hypothetical protein